MKITNLNIGPYTKRHKQENFSNKYILHHEVYTNLYDNFNNLTDLSNGTILDFGGSFGNLIVSSKGRIQPKNYTCCDVDKQSLEQGKESFPDSNWIHINAYNPMYNPIGQLDYNLPGLYDTIIAYSVFTHDSYNSFIMLLKKFKSMLNANGKIFATVLLADQPYINFLRDKRAVLYGDCDQIDQTKDINYLVNNRCFDHLPEKFECDFLLTVYKKTFIEQFGKIHYTDLYQEAVLEVDTNAI